MRDMRWLAALAGMGLGLFLTACGGSISSTPPPATTYMLTVNSTSPAAGVPITVSPADVNGAADGTTGFTRTYDAGTSVTLIAPAAAGGYTFVAWSGCSSVNTLRECTVAMSANTTVTAGFTAPALITPTVTVTPSASSITTAQQLTVTVVVSVPSGDAAPTGTVTLTSGSYHTSAALSGGSATINVPAGSLASGIDTLTVIYAPDAASSSIYSSASGTAPETVLQAYVLTVNSTNPSSGVSISVNLNPLTPLEYLATTSFTVSGVAGQAIGLGAPATANGNNFSSWTGCTSTTTVNCNVTLNGNMTVTANYATPKTTPTVTVTPSSSSITTAQALTVTVAVSGGSGNPTPTGSVVLTSGSYTSAAATLSGGSASINVAAGALAAGSDTLTVSYTPDAAGSATYTSATGTAPVAVTAVTTYKLTIDSTAPSSGVDIQAIPADINNDGYGPTPLTLTYNAGTAVTLTAPAASGSYAFISWTGCATTSGYNCNVTMNANTTVTANYNQPSVTSITVTPSAATIGTQVQFKATVAGTGAYSSAVTWTLSCPLCGSLSAGTLGSSGLYTTPYPAPASVTVTATSTQAGYTNVSGSATVTLSAPATAAGPALTVDLGNQTHAISPEIYGMDAYLLDATTAKKANLAIDRWGGDSTERYNYQLDVTSSIADWFFENSGGNGGDGLPAVSGVSAFDALVERNAADGIKTLGTVPVLGWVAKDHTSCSFPKSTYPDQLAVKDVNGTYYAFDPYDGGVCGMGVYPKGVGGCTSSSGCNITGNDPTVTSIAEPPPTPPAASAVDTAWADATWTGSWVDYLVGKFGPGNANDGTSGVAIYDLDNEPSWWDAEDFDVHPDPFTYDEVTQGGIGTALAIKTADPTAQVSGPVMDYWWDYFYSKKDIENGWYHSTFCWTPWSNPIDREAHGGVPFIEYYLQQMAAAETTYGVRLLDYVDLHTYFAATYEGNSVAFADAGDTGAQQARLNSTRVFWDPTYTDPNFPQPNYITDPNYTTNCSPPAQAPQLIPMMKNWVAKDYPNTKLAIDEYNWGGMEAVNGALAQADILGIFGREGLDLGAMWPTTNPSQQVPGTMAFAMYRNYDGNKSTFGDTALASTSTNSSNGDGEGQLAVYGAVRSSDKAITVMVINKTYGSLTSTIGLENFTAASGTTAQVYQYTSADLTAINQLTAVSVTPPASGGTTSTINYTFPAQSITLFVTPQ